MTCHNELKIDFFIESFKSKFLNVNTLITYL